MPLPDAKPDRRIYELLKNTDLENITFSEFQGVAKTIFAEQGAEDELRRIVLLNLARLSVVGEWTGLTSAGGSTTSVLGFQPITEGFTSITGYDRFQPWDTPILTNTSTSGTLMDSYAYYWRFISPVDGTLSQFTLQTSNTNTGKDNMVFGFYSTGSNGYPNSKLGQVTLDVNGGAALYTTTTFSSSVTLEAGKTYWIGMCVDGGTPPTITTISNTDGSQNLGMTHYSGTRYNCLRTNATGQTSLPATVTPLSDYQMQRETYPAWSVKF